MKSNALVYKVLLTSLAYLLIMLLGPAFAYAGNVSLTWGVPTTNTDGSPLTDLAGYKIYYGIASGNHSTTINVGNVTTYTITGLTDGVTYYFTGTAYNTQGAESDFTPEISMTVQTVDTTPPVLSGVYANNITSTSAIINWVTNEASSSRVEYGTTTSYGYINPLDTAMATAHSQVVAGLVVNTIYNYRVISTDAAGNQSVSANYTFLTAAAADTTPPVISNVQVTGETVNAAIVTWTTDEPSSSQLEYGLTSSYGYVMAVDSNLVTTHTVNLAGLSSYTTYNFRVKSQDAASNLGTSANYVFITSNTAPAAPSISATPRSGYSPLSVTLTAAASDSDGYITTYEWDYDGNGTFDANTGGVSSTTHTYSNIGTFNARVRVKDNGGASATSNPISISVTSAANQPPSMSSFTATPSSGSALLNVSFAVSAADPDGTISIYEWDFDGNGTYDATTTSAPASYTYVNAGTYTSRVRVTDNQGATATATTIVTVDAGLVPRNTQSSGNGDAVRRGGCFIATAAYGSYLDPNVMVLRKFRDRYLLTNRPGKALVYFYYSTSPPIADFISRHGWVKVAVRLFLTPLVYGLKYPVLSVIFVAVSAFAAWSSMCRRRRQEI